MRASLPNQARASQEGNTPDFAPLLTPHPFGGKVAHMGNTTPDGGDFLTTAQVASLTGWSVTSINRWAAAGDLPATKLPGRTGAYLFMRPDVDRFRERREPVAAT